MQAFVCSSVCVPPLRGLLFAVGNFILIYSLYLGLCVCALVCLVIDSLAFCDRTLFISSILPVPLAVWIFIPSRTISFMFPNFCLAPCLLGASFLLEHFTLPRINLSPKSFRGFIPSRTLYASAILSEPLVL
jgi:hypothetical protein